jgi:predicted DNA-binding transcriptional regulator YafY
MKHFGIGSKASIAKAKFKPQFQRLVFIDQKIRAGRYPNCTTLSREWEVSYKTIQRDIDYLKDAHNAPIEYDKPHNGFYYKNPTWFLPAVMLSEGDIFALLIGSQALQMYQGTPMAGELKAIYAKLAQLLPEQISVPPELIFNRLSFLGAPCRPINADIWKSLVRGILHQRVMWIEYASPRSKEPKEHTIHPLHLANIEGDWYVLAHETRWKDIAQFAVSRIRKAALQDATFVPPKGFDAKRVLKDRFGKFIHVDGGKRITVRLRFSPEIANYISERSWHPQQKLRILRTGEAELQFPVADLADVVPWVLSFGADVKVFQPRTLRAAVLARLRETFIMYRDGGK